MTVQTCPRQMQHVFLSDTVKVLMHLKVCPILTNQLYI